LLSTDALSIIETREFLPLLSSINLIASKANLTPLRVDKSEIVQIEA